MLWALLSSLDGGKRFHTGDRFVPTRPIVLDPLFVEIASEESAQANRCFASRFLRLKQADRFQGRRVSEAKLNQLAGFEQGSRQIEGK